MNPPKPTRLKILEGNPGKRPLNKREPKPMKGAPDCPAWLPKGAKVVWREIVASLAHTGMLTKADRGQLIAYCLARDVMHQAMELVAEEGQTVQTKTEMIRHPALVTYEKAAGMVHKFGQQFGLTPASRARLQAPEGQTEDDFAAWQRGRGETRSPGE